MQQRLIQTIKIATLLTIGFSAGLIFSFREAALAFYMVDSLPRGVIAAGNLKQLEKGSAESTKVLLNMDVNQGLYFFSLMEEEWWYPLYKQGIIFPENYAERAGYIQRLATYRKQKPDPIEDPAMFDIVPEGKEEYASDYKELAQSHRDRLKRINLIVDQYAIKQ